MRQEKWFCDKREENSEIKNPNELLRRLVWLLGECKLHLTKEALNAEECDGGQTLEEAINEALAQYKKEGI